MYCHIRALKYLLAADEKNVWKNQKRILESDMRVGVSCRCCVSFLQENGSEWMTPSILQWCRESRKLANSVVPPFTPHSWLSKSYGAIKESKEVSECTMILRNICTAYNNKKCVIVGSDVCG